MLIYTASDKMQCFKCGRFGHYANQCQTIICYKCKQFGHYANQCNSGAVSIDIKPPVPADLYGSIQGYFISGNAGVKIGVNDGSFTCGSKVSPFILEKVSPDEIYRIRSGNLYLNCDLEFSSLVGAVNFRKILRHDGYFALVCEDRVLSVDSTWLGKKLRFTTNIEGDWERLEFVTF